MGKAGFGIPFLLDVAKPLIDAGLPIDEIVEQVAYVCELRSDEIEAFRVALTSDSNGANADGDLIAQALKAADELADEANGNGNDWADWCKPRLDAIKAALKQAEQLPPSNGANDK